MRAALQLYTVRDECAKDFFGTLRKVAAMGYRAVQVSGWYNTKPADLKKVLDDLGLQVAGTHEPYDDFKNNIDALLERNAILGTKHVTLPWAQLSKEPTAESYDQLAEEMNVMGAACAKAGFTFTYHNHAHEFVLIDGQYGLDRLFAATDPKLVQCEIDVGWTYYAGVDPAAYVRKYPGRVPLLHAKDHDKENKDINTPVGEGALNWPAIFEACREVGTDWVLVEEDNPTRPSLHSVAISLRNLQEMGIS